MSKTRKIPLLPILNEGQLEAYLYLTRCSALKKDFHRLRRQFCIHSPLTVPEKHTERNFIDLVALERTGNLNEFTLVAIEVKKRPDIFTLVKLADYVMMLKRKIKSEQDKTLGKIFGVKQFSSTIHRFNFTIKVKNFYGILITKHVPRRMFEPLLDFKERLEFYQVYGIPDISLAEHEKLIKQGNITWIKQIHWK